ncbi:sensor domain-containing diguanylate cyclase [Fusibacter bizertensis]
MLNLLILQYKDRSLEREYRLKTNEKNIVLHRFLYALSIPFYLIFALVDVVAVNNLLSLFWIIRFGIYTPVASIALVSTLSPHYYKFNQLILWIVAFVGAVGMLILTFAGSSQGFYSYKYGFLFALIFFTILSKLRFLNILIGVAPLVLSYWLVALIYPVVPPDVNLDSVVLFSCVSIMGLIASYFYEYSERKQFYYQKLLEQESLKVNALNDELENKVIQRTQLLNNANKKLLSLNEKLSASEYTFRMLFDESMDAILIEDSGQIINCNRSLVKLMGYNQKNDLIGKSLWSFYASDNDELIASLQKTVENYENREDVSFKWWMKHKTDRSFLAEIKITRVLIDGKKVSHMLIRDITERFELEQKMEYLSYHDQLTGLYNRRFFTEELTRLDVERNLPICIIFADVNGLKLINDSFGHSSGDELLKSVAEVMKNECRSDEIISRLGGDEFVMLLPKTTDEDGEGMLQRLKNQIENLSINNVQISIAFGHATKVDKAFSIKETLERAEKNMYQMKNKESTDVRLKLLSGITAWNNQFKDEKKR